MNIKRAQSVKYAKQMIHETTENRIADDTPQ